MSHRATDVAICAAKLRWHAAVRRCRQDEQQLLQIRPMVFREPKGGTRWTAPVDQLRQLAIPTAVVGTY